MRVIRLMLASLLLAVIALPTLQVLAAGRSAGATASDIRASLFDAQLALSSNLTLAGENLARAQASYSGEFATAIKAEAPEADARIQRGFEQAAAALADGEAPAFAAARAQIWTSILAGGYTVVEHALQDGDGAAAQRWLTVREFRTLTRFSRPSSDATKAVDGFIKGSVNQADAQLSLKADLFDTYQARLTETLHDLDEADASNFSTRRAELAASAEGYFLILAPAFSEQRGNAAGTQAAQAFASLREASLQSQSLDTHLQQVDALILNFRAAPLSLSEQSRRAGQMTRFLNLVAVEYGRGVTDGQVTRDFEIQEAVTFHAGAYAAFSDLQSLLDARDHAQTAEIKSKFDALGTQLADASKGTSVARSESIQTQVDELSAQLKTVMPEEWSAASNSAGDFDVISSMLDQMEASVQSGDYDAAESSRLEAYAIMEIGPEARLMVFAPELKITLEDLFWNGQGEHKGLAYLIKNQAPIKVIRASRAQLDGALTEAQTTLGANTSPVATGVNAGMILFREGLEAIIILASLMGSMKRESEKRYRKPMWVGAGLALLATVVTWFLAHDVLQSLAQYGEKLEAIVSLIAVAILLLIMNWFFHKMYWTEWIAGFHARKRQILTGEAGLMLGLVTLGFTSVYREGFETVLFLQALVLENGVGVVLLGVAGGTVAVALIGMITFWLQINLPYKKMLILTGVLVGVVLLQMVGTTVHVMQIVGWVPIHVIGGVTLPYWLGTWLGIYATWESLIAQIAAAVFVIGTYYIAEAQQKRQREGKIESQPGGITQQNAAGK